MDPLLDLALPGLIHDLNNVFQTLMDSADTLAGDPRWAHLLVEASRLVSRDMYRIRSQSKP